MSGIKTLVIHLERAQQRRPQVEAILANSPYDPEILPACDGAKLSEAERNRLYPGKQLFKPRYPFSLSVGEIGCFESHRMAWARILDGNHEAGLILEDDLQIDAAVFKGAVQMAAKHLSRCDYIQFQVRPLKGSTTLLAQEGGFQLFRPEILPLRTSAQLVSAHAAKRLLQLTSQIDRPVDTFVQLFWETGLRVGCMVPSGVADLTAQSGGSTVSRKRNLGQKLRAEFLRARYRLQVRKKSRAQ